jgi:hypothetical protein
MCDKLLISCASKRREEQQAERQKGKHPETG